MVQHWFILYLRFQDLSVLLDALWNENLIWWIHFLASSLQDYFKKTSRGRYRNTHFKSHWEFQNHFYLDYRGGFFNPVLICSRGNALKKRGAILTVALLFRKYYFSFPKILENQHSFCPIRRAHLVYWWIFCWTECCTGDIWGHATLCNQSLSWLTCI